ncbi:MAG: hypothetical protein JSU57_04845 [Candidatus Heimdallarchaeota archaeon]|nr:MAG: hypothetical protein JSU57_04845 [Candidatus Heimdallarchaeota archaeon]
MSKKQPERNKGNLSRLPWIPGLKKPTIDFRVPDIELPYEAPHKYILALILFVTLFILAGGLYNLTEQPLPMGQTETQLVPVFKSSSEQFLVESLIAGLFFGLGGGGLFLIRHSTRFAYDIRSSITLLILGIILTLVAAGGTVVMYDFKT